MQAGLQKVVLRHGDADHHDLTLHRRKPAQQHAARLLLELVVMEVWPHRRAGRGEDGLR